MCGISGYISEQKSVKKNILKKMCLSLHHRGPDSSGYWIGEDNKIGLSHSRLSIIDLSDAGHQPMTSYCGRYVMVFNGEIYNYKDIRHKLQNQFEGLTWRGNSDTEVLLTSFSLLGLKKTLQNIRGMFSLAIWDKLKKCIYLARDRIGEKPLYYGENKDVFFFSSELKALKSAGEWNFEIDPKSLSLQLRYGYIPSPYSIYKDIYKLEPGEYLKVNLNRSYKTPKKWWDFKKVVFKAKSVKKINSFDESVKSLDRLLHETISEQMYSDVPLGALLSGGIDSSLIVSIMQSINPGLTKTFSLGFSEKNYDESFYSRDIASYLKTDHREIILKPNDALEIIPNLAKIYDEPFGDSSQIPTTMICNLARKHITVALTGDAGDEIFSGYNRYFWVNKIWDTFGKVPISFRSIAGKSVSNISSDKWDKFFYFLKKYLFIKFSLSNPGEKVHKLAEIIDAKSREEIYLKLVSQFKHQLPLKNSNIEPTVLQKKPNDWPSYLNFSEKMMFVDTLTYLPEDILTKIDRASMSVGLETRLPFLDPRLIEFAWKLPIHYKLEGTEGKKILKSLLKKYIPSQMIDRPKQGFSLPINKWLRGPLREWANDLLSFENLNDDPFLDANAIRSLWNKHINGLNMDQALWNVLMYQAWKKQWA